MFTRYPVAARLTALALEQWQTHVSEFLQRLERDRPLLSAQFNSGRDLGQIRSLRAGLSDPHGGGRSVLIFAFEGGLRLVYKPRSLKVDELFFSLLGSLNGQLTKETRLRRLCVLDRGKYGWMEYAGPSSCANRFAAGRYARRAGALACLAYWLQATDCHYGNVVAAGEHPILVDLEGLAHPLFCGVPNRGSASSLPSVENCVLRTCLLPMKEFPAGASKPHDYSGFCAPVTIRQSPPTLCWERINTDAMRAVDKIRVERHASHRLRVAGRCVDLRYWETSVRRGFREMALLLTGSMKRSAERWAGAIWEAERRRIKRSTLVYRMLLQQSLQPECLADGVDRSVAFEALPWGVGNEQERAHEISEMENLDVPYFRVSQLGDSERPTFPNREELFAQDKIIRLSLLRKITLREGKLCLT